ncbi:hypothetical protein ABPG75_000625 [Micractinium tetrahymenae]
MGQCTSKAQGVCPEPRPAAAGPSGDKHGSMGLARGSGGLPADAAAAPPLEAASLPATDAAALSSCDASTEQASSGHSSACLTLSARGRSNERATDGTEIAPKPAAEAPAVPPEAEVERLAAMRLFCATPPAECCSSVSALLRASLGVPLAFVCLVGEEEAHLSQPLQLGQQAGAAWVTVRRGEAPGELTASPPGGVLVVQDMAADASYRALPCVAGPPQLACLAAVPLVASAGEAAAGAVYGSLVVADTQPRTFNAVQLEMLAFSAGSLVRDLEFAAQAARRRQAQHAQQALLRCAQGTVEGHADAVLALNASQDDWPVLFCSKPAALTAAPALEQPAGVPFWQLFSCGEADVALESCSSLWSIDSVSSLSSPLPHGSINLDSSPGGRAGISGAREGLTTADSLRQSLGTPEVARWLLAGGKPFSLTCRPRAPAQGPLLPGGGSGTLVSSGPLAGWAEEAPDKLLPAPASARRVVSGPRASADTCRPLQAAAPAPSPARLHRPGSLDSALAAIQEGSRAATKEEAFAVSFAPCTPALLRSLGAASVPDVPGATAAGSGSGGNSSSAGNSSSGGDIAAPCWVATLRPQPEITSGALQRAHSACCSGGQEVEAFLRPEAFQDVQLGPLIAAGAYGRAFRGLWKGQRVAVKIVPMRPGSCEVTPNTSGTPSAEITPVAGGTIYSDAAAQEAAGLAKAPFMEALLSTSLDHPHIVKTLAFGMCHDKDAGQQEVWVLQELCTCGTLARAVERGVFTDRATKQPRLRRILQTGIEIASAIAFLHSKSRVHADLSGNNVMLNRASIDERGFVALVGDFGLARPLDLRSSICTGTYGTPSYMSPEMISEGRLSPEVDIFSAGVLLHEMLSGHRAWEGMNVIQVVNTVAIMKRSLPIPDTWPQPLQDLVRSCLSHDPKARPTAKQLLAELARLLEDEVAASLA